MYRVTYIQYMNIVQYTAYVYFPNTAYILYVNCY